MDDAASATRFARALADALPLKPRRALEGTPRLLPSSAGGANLLFAMRAGDVDAILKVRADAHDDASSEARTLRAAGPHAPALLAHTTVAAVVARLMQRRDPAGARAASAPRGGVLLVERLAGAHPSGVDEDALLRFARALHGLWQRRAPEGVRLRTPSSPRGLAAIAGQTVDDVRAAGVLDARTSARLARALRRAVRDLERAGEREEWARVRTLCHGDLRWHNVIDDGQRVRFIDFEHAGRGDPALDLAMMAVRSPLPPLVEHVILDEVLARRRDPSFAARYFGMKHVVAVLAGASAVLDLVHVARGARPVDDDAARHVDTHLEACRAELQDALELVEGRADRRQARVARPSASVRTRAPRPEIIAVDGTAGSGKSVLAALVARALGVPHLNTGAAFRVAALLALEHGIVDDADALARALARARLGLTPTGDATLDGAPLGHVLNTLEVDRVVARVAAAPLVRAAVWRALASSLDVRAAVVEGRDVAATVFPAARAAFFVDAKPAVRAARIHERLARKVPLATVARITAARDHLDATRTASPMVRAARAIVVDTTRGSGEENAEKMLRVLTARRTRR